MTREEAIARVKHQRDWANEVNRMLDVEAFEMAAKALEDVEALNAINLDLASENEDLVERIGKLIGYIDFLRNTAQGKKKSLNLLEKVVKGELEEIRAEGENFVKPRTGEWIPVTEKLPEEKINPITVDYFEYQCTVRFGNLYDVRSYKYGEGHWRLGATIVDDYVIAWRELPEPYKEDAE